MSYKLTVCITETLERLIELEVDDIDCDPIEYVRQQYLDEEIILDSSDLVETNLTSVIDIKRMILDRPSSYLVFFS